MKNPLKIILLIILSFACQACMTQPKAEIEFHHRSKTSSPTPEVKEIVTVTEQLEMVDPGQPESGGKQKSSLSKSTIEVDKPIRSKSLQANGQTIKVRSGDNVNKIAKEYGVQARVIIEVNNLRRPYILKVGQELIIPKVIHYTVMQGDNIAKISNKYNIEQQSIIKFNNLKKPYKLFAGQKLELIKTKGANHVAQHRPSDNKVSAKSIASSRFIMPVNGKIIRNFGDMKDGDKNQGINISAKAGTPVKAADDGEVVLADRGHKLFGNMIIIKHNDGMWTAYAHLQDLLKYKGQKIEKGNIIGHVGSTGKIDKPQLHFAVKDKGVSVDPRSYLPK